MEDDYEGEGDEEEFAQGAALGVEHLLTFGVAGKYVICEKMTAEAEFSRCVDCRQ